MAASGERRCGRRERSEGNRPLPVLISAKSFAKSRVAETFLIRGKEEGRVISSVPVWGTGKNLSDGAWGRNGSGGLEKEKVVVEKITYGKGAE